MSCSNFSCSGTCYNYSGGGCQCGGSCTGWCSGGCMGCSGCGGCDGSCSGGCSSCSGTCSGTCSGCSNTCTGSCTGNCTNTCTGNCTGACKDNCGTGCNTGCSSSEALSLYQTLGAGLNTVIYASDMANINAMIQLEATRFGKNTTSVSFTADTSATSSQIKQLQANLATLGQTTSGNSDGGTVIYQTTGQELITKALNSADTTITSSSVGS